MTIQRLVVGDVRVATLSRVGNALYTFQDDKEPLASSWSAIHPARREGDSRQESFHKRLTMLTWSNHDSDSSGVWSTFYFLPIT